MTLGGAAQVATAHCPNERTLDPAVCSYNRPTYAPASRTMAFTPQCSPATTWGGQIKVPPSPSPNYLGNDSLSPKSPPMPPYSNPILSALVASRSVVDSVLASINIVNRHWARLVFGWVTVCGRVSHLGM